MIYNNRLYVAINAVGALCAVVVLVLLAVYPPTHPVFPIWLQYALGALLFGTFIYQIVRRLKYGRPMPDAFFKRFTDRELWFMRGIVFLVGLLVIAVTLIITLVPHHRP